MPDQEVITRRRLPHWYVPGASFFVTYRLAGSLPKHVLDSLAARKELLLRRRRPTGIGPREHRTRIHKVLFAEYDRCLDQHQDVRWLAEPDVAELVRKGFYHFNGQRYHLMSYCVMPNHVHVLFAPIIDSPKDSRTTNLGSEPNDCLTDTIGELADDLSPLASILHSWKSYTAHKANKILGRSGRFWQRESYDHWVRDDDELERVVQYIAANPIKAGLALRPTDFRYSSAYDRFQRDGETSGWLPE